MIESNDGLNAIRLTDVRPASDREWDDIWAACDYSTYFHSREWAELWEKYTQGQVRPDARLVSFSDGTMALLPFSYRVMMNGYLRQFLSSPAGTFGGWLSLDKLSKVHGQLLYSYILDHFRNLVWRLNPYDPIQRDLNIKCPREDSTQILFLADFATEKELKSNYKHSVRKQINKSLRAGFSVRKAESWANWEEYYGIYQEAIARWGGKGKDYYSIELFRGLYDLKSCGVVLWLVTSCYDKIIGGNLNFYHRNHCVEWHAVFKSEYFAYGVRDFLVHQIILDAWRSGYAYYDFNPSGGHQGVRRFKATFGSVALPAPVVFTILENHGTVRALRNLRKYLITGRR